MYRMVEIILAPKNTKDTIQKNPPNKVNSPVINSFGTNTCKGHYPKPVPRGSTNLCTCLSTLPQYNFLVLIVAHMSHSSGVLNNNINMPVQLWHNRVAFTSPQLVFDIHNILGHGMNSMLLDRFYELIKCFSDILTDAVFSFLKTNKQNKLAWGFLSIQAHLGHRAL